MEVGSDEKERCAEAFDDECGAEDLHAGEDAQEQDIDLVAADKADGQSAEDQAECSRVDVEHFHENNRRAGDIHEQAGEGKGTGEREDNKLRFF